MFWGIFKAEEVAAINRKAISSMKISINDLFLLACGTYFWLESPLLHMVCCPEAVMMPTADARIHDLTEPNMRFSSGGGPLTWRQWKRIYLFHLNSYRTSVSSCKLVMVECAALNVSEIIVCHRGHRRARHTHSDSLSAKRDRLCLANGTARHGLTLCDESSKRRSVSAMKHTFFFIRANMEFVFALVSAKFCRPAKLIPSCTALVSLTFEPLLHGHSSMAMYTVLE